jgi:hypothetical protein
MPIRMIVPQNIVVSLPTHFYATPDFTARDSQTAPPKTESVIGQNYNFEQHQLLPESYIRSSSTRGQGLDSGTEIQYC